MQIAAKMNANGYSVEIAVPFRLMPNYQLGNRPKPGEKIRFMPVLVKNGKREIEELPEAYIIPVAEYLATQEEATNE